MKIVITSTSISRHRREEKADDPFMSWKRGGPARGISADGRRFSFMTAICGDNYFNSNQKPCGCHGRKWCVRKKRLFIAGPPSKPAATASLRGRWRGRGRKLRIPAITACTGKPRLETTAQRLRLPDDEMAAGMNEA